MLGKILYQGLSKNILYLIPFDVPLRVDNTTSFTIKVNYAQHSCAYLGKLVKKSLWHQRFGHTSNDIVTKMLNKSSPSSIFDIVASVCQACLQGKYHKLPFTESSSKSLPPFELVRTDVWGPSPYPSIDGFKYYVLFCDDFTIYTWIFPLGNKSVVFGCFNHCEHLFKIIYLLLLKLLEVMGMGNISIRASRTFLHTKESIIRFYVPIHQSRMASQIGKIDIFEKL